METSNSIEVRPYASALGAEIIGVDLAQPLDDGSWEVIRDAFHKHLVIFFRDQHMTSEQQVNFSKRFGELEPYPYFHGIEGFPELIDIVKMPDEIQNFGAGWHVDMSFRERPPLGAVLYGIEVPPVGGDTMFANMYAAYEALSPGMQRMLRGLRAVNSSALADVSKTREDRIRDAGTNHDREFESVHPVVRTHPETGRKGLYVNVAHTARFTGMTEEESKPLLRFLFEHSVRPEFTCRFRWQVGSLALWDNRCAMHNPINDYQGYTRTMHRITLAGDTPR